MLSYVSRNVDTDGNRFLSRAERDAVKRIELPNTGLVKVQGLECFDKLQVLDLSSNTGIQINVLTDYIEEGYFPELNTLDISNTRLQSFSAVGTPKLRNLDVSDNSNLSFIEISEATSLVNLVENTKPTISGGYSYYSDTSGRLSVSLRCDSTFKWIYVCPVSKYFSDSNFAIICQNVATRHNYGTVPSVNGITYSGDYLTADLFWKAREVTTFNANSFLSGLKVNNTKGIELFPNVENFNANGMDFYTADFSSLHNLKGVNFNGNKNLSRLSVGDNNLENVLISDTLLRSFDISGYNNLTMFNCSRTGISSVNLGNKPKLARLEVSGLHLTSLNVSGCPNLTYLDATSNSLTSLDLSKNPYLTTLYVNLNSTLPSIDISNNRYVHALYETTTGTASNSVHMYRGTALGLETIFGVNATTKVVVNHTYDTANCVSGKCTICGSVRGGSHVYDDQYDPTCNVCGATRSVPTRPSQPSQPVNPDQPSTPSNPDQPSQPSNPSSPSTPSQPSAPAGEQSEGGVAGFVERLYTVALGRNSDPNGKAAWINAIKNGESGAQAAKGFLFSEEFLNKNMSNADFVTTLYRTFFDRQPDAAGHAAWVAALERGDSKQDVIMGFINSTEWANVCLRYGINSGGTGTPNIVVEPNEQVIAFATRLYTTCLKRDPDQNGLMAWARQLANLRDTGSNAAHGFFFSEEMNNNPVSNEEFVTRLYLTFMDRQPDQGGMTAWVGQLDAGVSREEVFQGFAQSDEFGAICANYGIIR